MATDYGTAFSCVGDLTQTLSRVSGNVCVAEAVARRLITPPGALLGSPDYGYDLRQWIGSSHPRPLGSIEAAIAEEARKDERVLDATASVAFYDETGTLAATFALVGAAGPFTMVLTVGQVTSTIILDGVQLDA